MVQDADAERLGRGFTAGLAHEPAHVLLVAEDPQAGRTGLEVLFDLEDLRGAELTVEVLIEALGRLVTIHELAPSAGRGADRAYSSSRDRSMRRPRNSRDITVPNGTSSISAISL